MGYSILNFLYLKIHGMKIQKNVKYGWIGLYRSITNHWLYPNNRVFTKYEAWIDILLMVNYKEKTVFNGSDTEMCEAGQTFTSQSKLMNRWKWSKSKLILFLKVLEKEQMLEYKTTTKKTTLKVLNYQSYQDFKEIEKLKKDHKKTVESLRKDYEKSIESLRKDTNNKDNTTNKEKEEEEKTTPNFDLNSFYPVEKNKEYYLANKKLVDAVLNENKEMPYNSVKELEKGLDKFNIELKSQAKSVEELREYISYFLNWSKFQKNKPKKDSNGKIILKPWNELTKEEQDERRRKNRESLRPAL